MTTANAVDYHRKESRRRLSQVDDALERGDIEQASQSLWDAADHAIKAAAERRGWAYDSFGALCTVIDRLVAEEGGPKELHWNFVMANAFDRKNLVWEIPFDEEGVRYCKGPVGEFIQTLEGMDR